MDEGALLSPKEEAEQWKEIMGELMKEAPAPMKIVMGLGIIFTPVLISAYYLYEQIDNWVKRKNG